MYKFSISHLSVTEGKPWPLAELKKGENNNGSSVEILIWYQRVEVV
jgi:hypothetical protein